MARIEHIALWTSNIERIKAFYLAYFDPTAGDHYANPGKGFQPCCLEWAGGARIELMKTSTVSLLPIAPGAQRMGLTHFALSLGSAASVDDLTQRLRDDGYDVLDGPRRTGDGYYESV